MKYHFNKKIFLACCVVLLLAMASCGKRPKDLSCPDTMVCTYPIQYPSY
jgi:hypothetical protein